MRKRATSAGVRTVIKLRSGSSLYPLHECIWHKQVCHRSKDVIRHIIMDGKYVKSKAG